MKGRVYFGTGAVQHVYQNTHNGFLIFYSVRDCLVFFTVFMTVARLYHVRILGLCLMPDHIHVLLIAQSRKELGRFVHHYTRWYARLWNERHGQSSAAPLPTFSITLSRSGWRSAPNLHDGTLCPML